MCNKTNAKEEMNWIADAGRLGRIAVMVMSSSGWQWIGGEEDDAMDEWCECEGEITPRVIRFLTDEVQLSRVR